MTLKEFFIGIKDRLLQYWKFEADVTDYAIIVITKILTFAIGLGVGYFLWGN